MSNRGGQPAPPAGGAASGKQRSAERAEAQRNRILDAARRCFIDHGFHAASMARIAETAGISQGLAYRYFQNKSAIIRAIIERQLTQRRFHTDAVSTSAELAGLIVEFLRAPSQDKPQAINPVLFAEMCAEASRDPEIKDAMQHADRIYRADFNRHMNDIARHSGKSISQGEIDARFYAMQCLIEGTFVRSVRRTGMKRREMNRYIAEFITRLVTID